LQPAVSFAPALADDFEELLALRVEAMRESLERIRRFDPQRARERFQSSFAPAFTRHVLLGSERVGFVALRPGSGVLLLDHLYLRPAHQGHGLGSAVLARLFAEADAAKLPVRVGALRDSDSNRFYLRHGFVEVEQTEWDIFYVRQARSSG
jgi:GNAT superfamily N-acetyltransferase